MGGANNGAMYSPGVCAEKSIYYYMRRVKMNQMSFYPCNTYAFSYRSINSSSFWDTFITGIHLLSLYIPGRYLELEVILTELAAPLSGFPVLLVPMNTTWTDIIAMVAAKISIREAFVKRARQAEKRAEKRRMNTSPYTGSTM